MPTIHARNVPEELYARIRRLAEKEHRSISTQVITMLERAASDEEAGRTQAQILSGIARRRNQYAVPPGTPSSLDLLREDRER